MTTSNHIKTALLYYFGFKKGYFCCTELGYMGGNADVFCISKQVWNKEELKSNDIIEIEVKISKADLLNEFKDDDKHITKSNKYRMFDYAIQNKTDLEHYPNKFYICVPTELCETCKELLEQHDRPYVGILEYKPHYTTYSNVTFLLLEESISVYRPAKKIYKNVSLASIKFFYSAIMNRLRNDCIGFYKEKYFNTKRYDKIIKE